MHRNVYTWRVCYVRSVGGDDMATVKIVYPHLGIIDEIEEADNDISEGEEKQEGQA